MFLCRSLSTCCNWRPYFCNEYTSESVPYKHLSELVNVSHIYRDIILLFITIICTFLKKASWLHLKIAPEDNWRQCKLFRILKLQSSLLKLLLASYKPQFNRDDTGIPTVFENKTFLHTPWRIAHFVTILFINKW